jgi:ATP-dependent helicase/nuclease subunit A
MRYHEKVKSDFPQQSYFVLGKVAHKIIEEHTKAKGEIPVKDIMHQVLSGAIPVEGGAAIELKDMKRLANHVKNYSKLADKIGYDGEIEWEFNIDLEYPNEVKAKGFIDRLIIKNGKASIIDYKTTQLGPWRKNSETIKKDLQLATYSWIVMNQLGIEPKDISCALYYLEDGDLMPVRFSLGTIENAIKEMSDTFKKIKNHDPDKVYGTVGDHCKRCDYRNKCPFYKPQNRELTGSDYSRLLKLGIKKNV